MKYIILAILSLVLTQCVVPYEQYTVQQEVQSAKGTTIVTRPATIINVQRSYYTPNYRYYTRPAYYNCSPRRYYTHYPLPRTWGCY